MNHFLVKVGRTRFGRYFMPTLTAIAASGHLMYESYGHSLVEKLLGASLPDGSPMRICDHLRNLIVEVHEDARKGGFRQNIMENKFFKFADPPIRWFASATVDPYSVGMMDYASGVTIAIPSYYNYTTPEEIPNSLFEIKKISLFRSLRLTEQQKQEETEKQTTQEAMVIRDQGKNPAVTIRNIDRQSELGEAYTDSMLLSDDAKRYSLAKELFATDTFKSLITTTSIFLSLASANSLARAQVDWFKLKDAHITQRYPGYALSALVGYSVYVLLMSAIELSTEKSSHEKTIKLGDRYENGAQEYYRKRAKRNEILGITEFNFLRQKRYEEAQVK